MTGNSTDIPPLQNEQKTKKSQVDEDCVHITSSCMFKIVFCNVR